MAPLTTLLNRDLPAEKLIPLLKQAEPEIIKIIQETVKLDSPPALFSHQRDSSLISLLHQKIYQLVEEASEATLFEAEEMRESRTRVKYWLTVGDNPLYLQLFALFLRMYDLEAQLRFLHSDQKYSYVGVDYEFNNRQIALMQMNFERLASREEETHSYLWIINPTELETDDYETLMKLLMRNRHIFKILHGADSLDVPYMFNVMFNGHRESALEFTSRFIDTRFLCEYFLASQNQPKKCAIYEALLKYRTISEAKYKFLHDTHDGMGPVQDISWNIHKMSSFERKYALYDVIFLKRFLSDIHRMAKTETPEHYPFYRTLGRLTQFVILERREITSVTLGIKTAIDPIHNYMIRTPRVQTLISIYNLLMVGLKAPRLGFEMDLLMMINYFRTQMVLVMKRLVYGLILELHPVYAKKDQRYSEQLPVSDLYQELNDHNFHFLTNLLKYLEVGFRKRIARM